MRKLLFTLFISWFVLCCQQKDRTSTESEDEGDIAVSLQIDLSFNLDFAELQSSLTKSQNGGKDDVRRFIVELLQDRQTAARHIIIDENAISEDRDYSLPLQLNLKPELYQLVIWSDYVHNGSESYYNCGKMDNITCTEPYIGNRPHRECLYGSTTIDLSGYGHHPLKPPQIHVHVKMHSPLAKYCIIATDIQEYLRQHPQTGPLSAQFNYAYFFPMVFDALAGKVKDAWSGVGFETPLLLEEDAGHECLLGYDYIFADPEENLVILDLSIRNGQGGRIIQPPSISIPYKQGYITSIRGNFLTGNQQGGLHIHTEYDGEINVDLDDILLFN